MLSTRHERVSPLYTIPLYAALIDFHPATWSDHDMSLPGHHHDHGHIDPCLGAQP